ncbi:MAG: hypothetical protein KGO22_16890 [Gammaproteobacteria bacterium]|nr:hypothetical protein [Gammaproteobacteria bacterium]
MNEPRPRQQSLLEHTDRKPFPQEVEAKALELLVELFIAVIPALEGAKRDEQDHQ